MSLIGNKEARKVALSDCKKIYIQRDYSNGMEIRYLQDYPGELHGKVDEIKWMQFIRELNAHLYEAESVSKSSVAENLFGFLTCYTSRLCLRSTWDRKLADIADLLQEANADFVHQGVFVQHPIEKGFRTVEIALLDEPLPSPPPQVHANAMTPMLQPR
jgi:hypothetical protein